MTYHFERLSDFDFEALARDLLEAEMGVRFEHFARGRDGGIDLRYAELRHPLPAWTLGKVAGQPAQSKTIVQCKHYLGTGYPGLKSHVKSKEAPKLKKLNPDRLILVTSVDLTPGRKDDLMAILSPFVKTPGDIIGQTELVALIAKHAAVERRHYKLWLTSTGVLDRVLHSDIYNQTLYLQQEVEDRAKTYVQNDSFPRAMGILEKERVCIVAGPPGIGKTTLAQMLMLQFASLDYEPILVSEDIQQAATVWNPERKQFFYYDDFLGQTASHEKLGKNEDGRLALFLRTVNKSKNKLVVLTTREYILEQAKTRYERIARADFEPWKCIVTLGDYTKKHRAQILYNHLYFSALSGEMLRAFRESGVYRKVIDHPNYNPRLIEHVATHASVECASAADFPAYLLRVLDDPSQLWQHPFDHQLTEEARSVLLVLATLPVQTTLEALQLAASALHSELTTQRVFHGVLRVLDGDFVRTQRPAEITTVGFANPSLRDYLIKRIRGSKAICDELLVKAAYFDQVVLLGGYVPTLVENRLYVETMIRTIGSKSSMVMTLPDQWGRSHSSIVQVSVEERLLKVLRAGATLDSGWVREFLKYLGARWEEGTFGEHADELSGVLAELLPAEEWTVLACAMRDGLLKGFDDGHYPRLWCWLRAERPDLLTEAHEEAADEAFYGYADAEIEALSQLEDPGAIEGGQEDLSALADEFGYDVDSLNFKPLTARLEGLWQRESINEDEWREQRHEQAYEREAEDTFIENLFDGLEKDDK